MTTHDLIARLEGAEAGSLELDREIYLLLRPTADPEEFRRMFKDDSAGFNFWLSAQPVTTSLDAALALAERLGLDVSQILNDTLEGPHGDGIWFSGWNAKAPIAPQIARFVCIAILRAHTAQSAEPAKEAVAS